MTTTANDSGPRVKPLSFIRILRSEWIKLFTLRSTWWLLAVTVAVNIGFAVFVSLILRWSLSSTDGSGPSVPSGSLGSLSGIITNICGSMGILVFVILSILIITNEYSSGMIRSTFTAGPRRSVVLLAKVVVITIVTIVVFGLSVAGGWLAGYGILHGSTGVDLTLTSGSSPRVLGGFIIEMILISLFCFGLGAWIKSSAGSIGAAIGAILILPMLFNILTMILMVSGQDPTGWRKWLIDAGNFLPKSAGDLITQATPSDTAILGPWQGLGVLGIWALAALVIAFIATARRDI